MSVTAVSDEMLMALADGELSAEESVILRRQMAGDPDLAVRFAVFAESRALVHTSVLSSSSAASDDRLATAVYALARSLEAPDRPAMLGGGQLSVVSRGQEAASAKVLHHAAGRLRGARLPMAAALALMVGGAGGYFLHAQIAGRPPSVPGMLVTFPPGLDRALERALTHVPSGEDLVWTDSASGVTGRIHIVASYRLTNDVFCREYEIKASAQMTERILGASCRRAERWRPEIIVKSHEGDVDFSPASGASAVEQYLATRGGTDALGVDAERDLITREWRATE